MDSICGPVSRGRSQFTGNHSRIDGWGGLLVGQPCDGGAAAALGQSVAAADTLLRGLGFGAQAHGGEGRLNRVGDP